MIGKSSFLANRRRGQTRAGGHDGARGKGWKRAPRAQPGARAERRAEFSIFFAHNPLKSPDSKKLMKENESLFSFIFFHFLAVVYKQFALRLYPRPRMTLGPDDGLWSPRVGARRRPTHLDRLPASARDALDFRPHQTLDDCG